jgi:hypothetical protein
MFNRDHAVEQITEGRCPCDRCADQLTDPSRSKGGWGHCLTCQCAWQISTVDRITHATTVPSAAHRPVTPAKT